MLFLVCSEICGARRAVSPNFSAGVETEVPLWYNGLYIAVIWWAGPFFCLLAGAEKEDIVLFLSIFAVVGIIFG